MEIVQNNYHLYQNLNPHKAAVRCVDANKKYLITGSIDKTCKIFKFQDGQYSLWNEVNLFDDFIYAVLAPENFNGFVVGSKNHKVYLLDYDGNPTLELEGHKGPICSLSMSPSKKLISGSWDSTAIVWNIENGAIDYKLEGHTYGVAVLALDNDIFITASQDQDIHIWQKNTKTKTLKSAHSQNIRVLAKYDEIGFISGSNDETLKIWSYAGDLLQILGGHTGFIFSISTLPDLRIISGADDNTLKIWKDGQEEQSILHPGTVWYVKGDQYGNIITACADSITRVFSTNPFHKASEEAILEFQRTSELVSAQGPEGLSEAELQKLPPITKLASTKGKQDGEIRLFKNGNQPEAYVWKADDQKWDKIGDVIGNKTTAFYEGDRYFEAGEYEYLFDVEIDESGIPKKLPYNSSDNPLEAAEKFLAREGLTKAYIEQITQFIKKNSRKPSSGTAASNDNFGKSNQMKNQPKKEQPKEVRIIESKFFPFIEYTTFAGGNFDGLSKKIFEFNEKLADNPQHHLNLKEQNSFRFIIETLKDESYYHSSKFTEVEYNLLSQKLVKWPVQYLLPVLDLLRLFLLHHGAEHLFSGLDSGISYITLVGQLIKNESNDVTLTLCLKVLANMFKNSNSRYAALKFVEVILDSLYDPKLYGNPKLNLRVAYSSVLLNISVGSDDTRVKFESASRLLYLLNDIVAVEKDGGILMRYLVSIGNLLAKYDEPSRNLCKDIGLIAKLKSHKVASSDGNYANISECINDLMLFF